jgi:rhodanese-related sulfurtransferase
VIDVREAHEWNGELGHIAGAQNVPMRELARAAVGWDRQQPLVVVCRSGRRSRQVCETLAGMGFARVTNLRGGMLDYRQHERQAR